MELPREVTELVAHTVVDNEDLGAIAAAVEIDDDNEPAPEHHPDHDNLPPDIFKEWGTVNFCHQKRENFRNTSPKISFPQNTSPTYLQLFELFLPMEYVKQVIIPRINGSLSPPIDYGEFLKWLGIWFLLATNQVSSRREFWSVLPVNIFHGAPF